MAVVGASSDPIRAFLTLAMARWRTADTAEALQRTEGLKDLRFLNLDQWDAADLRARGEDRPSLTIDQIGEPYRQLVGQLRRAKPALQINPVDNGADQATAEIFQGLIRHIETSGGAKAAREEAFKGAVGPGWGYYRIHADYDYDQDSTDPAAQFDQCLKYLPIENQFTVFRDPACPVLEPEKARYCLIIEDIPQDEFKARWPTAMATSQEAFAATGISQPDWFPEGSVRVADYFYTDSTKAPAIALLSDGRVVPVADVPAGVQPVQTRTPERRTVKLAKITGAEILEGNADKTAGRAWPGRYIPIIPIYGEALTVDGTRTLRGIVRAAREPQRMYNYQNSELVYEMALAPKSKVIMAEGQDEGYEEMWKLAPSQAFPALKYKPTTIAGERVEAPRIAQFTDATKIQALVMAINQHKADLRSTLSYYDPSDPARRNTDQSGRAILARREAMAEGAVNYTNAFGQALLYEGKVLLDLIPHIYHRPSRVLRLAGLEQETDGELIEMGTPYTDEAGVSRIYAWGAGRYDVTVSIGASYSTRRQEAADFQVELMKVLPPQMAAAMAPIAIRNMDGPGNKEIADRLDKTLPPELTASKAQGGPPPIPPELQQKLDEQGQMIEALTQQLQQATAIIKTDEIKTQRDVQMAEMKAQADQAKTARSDAVKLEIARIQAESDALRVRADLIKVGLELDREGGMLALQEETKRLLKVADLEISTRSAMEPPLQ